MEQRDLAGGLLNHFLPQPDQEIADDFTQKSNNHRNFPEIDLSNIHIGDAVLEYLPPELMRQLGVVPFDFDPAGQVLKVASADPANPHLAEKLSATLYGITVELYAAHPDAIGRVITNLADTAGKSEDRHEPVVSLPEAGPEGTLFEIPDHNPAPADMAAGEAQAELMPEEPVYRKTILFITPEGNISEHFMSSLHAEQYAVRIVESTAAALEHLESELVEYIFIHDSLRIPDNGQAGKFYRLAPGTAVRYYRSEAALLVNDTLDDFAYDLSKKNLSVIGYMNGAPEGPLYAHARVVMRLVDALSLKFDLPSNMRLALTTAASFHNLAEAHLTLADMYSQSDIIGLSAGRLAAWDYPPLVVRLLRRMYYEVVGTSIDDLNTELLAGHILTAADFYCHSWPEPSALSSEQLSQLHESLPKQTESIIIPEVLNGLLEVIAAMAPRQTRSGPSFHVHIFVSRGSLPDYLDDSLAGTGVKVSWSYTIDDCAKICARSQPQVLMIRDCGDNQDICDLILGLSLRGVAVDQVSTILLLEADVVGEAVRLIKHGIEDVFAATMNTDALVTKITRLRKRCEEKAQSRLEVLRDLGTHGSLEDMSLVDLLETARSNPRPIQINLSAYDRQLTVCVDKGNILFAECDEAKGIDAVLQGIGWRQGVWNIDAVDPGRLPAPNLNKKIDAVLLEACVKFDTALK